MIHEPNRPVVSQKFFNIQPVRNYYFSWLSYRLSDQMRNHFGEPFMQIFGSVVPVIFRRFNIWLIRNRNILCGSWFIWSEQHVFWLRTFNNIGGQVIIIAHMNLQSILINKECLETMNNTDFVCVIICINCIILARQILRYVEIYFLITWF